MVAGELRMGTAAGRWVLATTVLGSGLVMIDGTVVNVALERIGTELGAGFGGLQWTVNAYTLTLASLILLGGSLGDHLGRRRVFLIGVVWFALASLACGLAPNIGAADRGAGAAGRGRCAAHAGQPGADLRLVPRAGPRRGRRRLVRAGRHRRRGRPVPRRLAGRVELAGGVPDQPPARRAGRRRRAAARAGEPRRGVRAGPGHHRHGAGRARARRADLRRSPGSARAATGPALAGGARRRGAGAGGVRGGGAALPAPAGAAGAVRRTATFSAANAATCSIYGALGVVFLLLVLQLQTVAGFSPIAAGTALLPVTAVMLLFSARAGALAGRIGPRLPMTVGPAGERGAGCSCCCGSDADASWLADVLPGDARVRRRAGADRRAAHRHRARLGPGPVRRLPRRG